MDYEIELAWKTSLNWTDKIIADFPSFLRDHADCERKASAMAMSFVAKCPDKKEMILELIETALEELVHFKLVYEIMASRDISLDHEIKTDEYVKSLIDLCRSGRDFRLLDRLIVAAVVEARGAERFRLVAEALKDAELKQFYEMLWKSEHKHSDIFLKLAEQFWPKEIILDRLKFFIQAEGVICSKLPFRAALH